MKLILLLATLAVAQVFRRTGPEKIPQIKGKVPDKPVPKPNKPEPRASVRIKGPAFAYRKLDERNFGRKVEEYSTTILSSKHPRKAQAGGHLEGKPKTENNPLYVEASGHYASVSVIAPPGGTGKIRITGDGGTKEEVVHPGTAQAGATYSQDGVGKAEGVVSRPGEAHAIGFDSAADIDPDGKLKGKGREVG